MAPAGTYRDRPESADTTSDDASTASKAPAGIFLSSAISDGGYPGSASPWKNHGEPLSARIKPYVCMARKITRALLLNPDIPKLALSRNRAPIGG
ncbi:MAG: hypothetical protein BGO26_13540 [Actinobacteria bacterium 69-20]|nr:hypothetical protein [Actinomycetota bacterium]OJV24315.1 MAG: hypothetical protein BGO26_13540 [Actinobacteria bacterium 69-20]